MIIFFGGFIGSGRKSIARRFAARYGLHHYDIDDERFHRFVFDKAGRAKERPVAARGDASLNELYRRAAEKFPMLAKMHEGVVIDHAFHRKLPREYLFEEARKHFGEVAFVWIQSEEGYVRRRLELLERMGMIRSVADALRGRAITKKYFQLFRPAPVVFHRTTYRPEELKELRALIENQLQSAGRKGKLNTLKPFFKRQSKRTSAES